MYLESALSSVSGSMFSKSNMLGDSEGKLLLILVVDEF